MQEIKNILAPLFCKFKPVDIIAIIIIIGGLALKFTGADGVVGSLLAAVAFYYFGKQGRAKGDNNV